MNRKRFAAVAVFTILMLISLPLIVVRAAGGRIEGKITDPKGAAIVGATVRVTDSDTNKTLTAITDAEGRYKIEGLTAGTYTVAVSANGFAEGRLENVKLDEGAVVPGSLKLEISSVQAEVSVIASPKANADPIYQQLRQQAKTESEFAGPYATVNNLVLQRDAGTFTLKSGEFYFLPVIEERVTGGVFIGEGEFTMVPPTEREKQSLQLFTNEPKITEQFTRLVLRFTDKTFDEIKGSPNAKMGTGGPQASRARDSYRENQQLLRRQLSDNREMRTLVDLYTPARAGFFNAFIEGKRYNKLVFLMDPLGIPEVSPEEVLLLSYGTSDGGYWTAFHLADEYAKGTASSSEDHRLIDMTHHDIEASIKGAHMTATDVVTFRALVDTRVVPLNLYRTLRVSRVEDEQGKELNFIQQNKDEDADFGIIFPQSLAAGKTYKIKVQYDGGDALRDSGGGNFILVPRTSWYPNNGGTQFGDRAIFNMTFRFPKGFTFIGTGAPLGPDTREGDIAVAKWSSGTTELAVAGFNYGRFKKKELADKETGYNIEFYANEQIPDELRAAQIATEQTANEREESMTTLGSISTTKMAGSAIAEAQNATRIYNNFFGKLAYTRVAMTQQPAGNFGQAWPTLVFMPYTAFIDSTQRTQLMGVSGGTNTFWRYVGPHEIAHQWWGHMIGWDSYHDQWMSEGFSEFSASLYVQALRGNEKFLDFWEDQRKAITESTPATRDRKPYTVGPVTQGYRLNNGKTGNVARYMIYPKGAFILHMLRMMMFDRTKGGDAQFQAMMKDFLQTHFNKDVSTEDFKKAVEKHITNEMDIDQNGKMDWFFNAWVYGTEIPSYQYTYQVGADGSLSGKITQSGVSDKFSMLVPIYVDFGKGWMKLGTATLVGNSTFDIPKIDLPKGLKRSSINAFQDVLTVSVQQAK